MTLSYANSLLFCTKNCIHYNLHSLFIRKKNQRTINKSDINVVKKKSDINSNLITLRGFELRPLKL